MEGRVITTEGGNAGTSGDRILSLLFQRGHRPDIAALQSLVDKKDSAAGFSISHVPASSSDWIELLSLGLTFDCSGLAPGDPAPAPPHGTLLGLLEVPEGEAIALAAGPHLVDAPGMQPVVRALAGIGAHLCDMPGIAAVVWQPAHAWMTPTYFRKVVGKWLEGGPFPALGLTTLERDGDGTIFTRGLALMTGQELRFVADPRLGAADVARIAVRLVHALIEVDPLEAEHRFTGPEGEAVMVSPSADRRWLKVSVKR